MAHLPGFKHDIFLSYPRESREWVREFHSHLQEALNQLTGDQKPRVFFDDNDWGGQNSSKLLEAARHSALFVAVVLPAYVAPNKFTLKELEAFCNAYKVRGSDEPPIFDVEYYPIEDKHRPAQLKTPRRYQFWRKEGEVVVPLTLGKQSKEMYGLAGHIKKRLDEVVPPPLKPITRYSGKAVLLGQVTDDLVGTRDELRDYLEGLGVTVFPQAAYPKWGPQFREFFASQLKQPGLLLLIQLLSEVRSAWRDDEEESCAQFQRKAAFAHFQQKAPHDADEHVIVWRSDALDMATVKRQVEEHHDMPLLEGAQAMGLEQLKTTINEKLDKSIKEELDTSIEASKLPEPPFIYIAASKEDRECARRLQKIAVDCRGAAKIMEDEKPGKDFNEKVRYAAAVIFLYGNAQRTFVGKWLDTYFTSYRMRERPRKQRIETIYRAPPRKDPPADELNTDWHGLRKCGEYETFNPECMHNILKELTGGTAECPKCGTRS